MLKRASSLIGLVCVNTSLLLIISGCSANKPKQSPKPQEVITTSVRQENVPIFNEWIGTIAGMVNAQIKPQITGYLLKQTYKEGSFVKKGQVLFEIDPRTFQASLDQAKGQLATAQGQEAQATSQVSQAKAEVAQYQAQQMKTQQDVERYTPLAKAQAITQQEMDTAVQNNLATKAQVSAAQANVQSAKSAIEAAKAQVLSARAQVDTAKINLGFTRVTAPIDGIIAIAKAQIGDLVTPTTTLTELSTLDPVKVYFTVTEQEYLQFVKDYPDEAKRQKQVDHMELELILGNDSVYPRKGKFYLADLSVDQQTGSMRLAGIFPNPGNILRPGQFGRVRASTTTMNGALLVPQRAVTELQSGYEVYVVGSNNIVQMKSVKVGPRVGTDWIIEAGLEPTDRIIVEGLQKVKSGVQVTPKQQK